MKKFIMNARDILIRNPFVCKAGIWKRKLFSGCEAVQEVDFIDVKKKYYFRGDCPKTIGLPRINLSYVCTLKTE